MNAIIIFLLFFIATEILVITGSILTKLERYNNNIYDLMKKYDEVLHTVRTDSRINDS